MVSEAFQPDDIFCCTQCGDCCKGYGGTYVTEADIRAIADFIHVAPEVFRERFCSLSGGKPLLAQGKNGYCVFWDKNCTIHSVKPRMCREWPFLGSVLIDPRNWEIMAGSCPGIRTDVPDHIVQAIIRKMRTGC